ncbi:MAG: TIGR00296 family protein [Desulfurococcales archaeon]|nr:TIGR00296 family protein [Desulfurococcales archaeon]
MRGNPVDPEELSHEHGEFLVRFARRVLEEYFRKGRASRPSDVDPLLLRPGAVFVTIETFYSEDHRELRGCIGVTRPVKPLIDAVIESTLNSAFHDPRFPPMEEYELDQVTFEVSVLSDFEYLGDTPEERRENILIGRDGLVVERPPYAGLLLPSVPVDHVWDKTTFLSETCVKAGLWPDCWLDKETRVYRYRARVWREKHPRGPVEYRDLRKEYFAKLINADIDPTEFEEAV